MATPDTPTKYRHPLHKQVWMFKRDRSPFWWTGFHHQGKYIRTSTKTPHQAQAEEFAADWYFEQKVAIKTGKTPATQTKKNPHTVEAASVIAINRYRVLAERGEKSPQYLKGIIRVLNKHILPHFGPTAVDEIGGDVWRDYVDTLYDKNLANNTIHQIRNALSLCLNAAADKGWIKEAPRLRLESQTNKSTKRIWFEADELEKLLAALDEYVADMATTPHKKDAQELRDYAKFILYSGLRVGEASALRFCDIREFVEESGIPHIHIDVEVGKRGGGTCNPDRKIVGVYRSIKERRQPKDKQETLFEYHHRDAFNVVLGPKYTGLKFDKNGRKRDFVSLRHTYICNKILERVPVYEIANNCRTSTTMIDKHYARHLSSRLFKSFHKKDDASILNNSDTIKQADEELSNFRDEAFARMEKLAEIMQQDKEGNKDRVKGELNSIRDKNVELHFVKHEMTNAIQQMAEMFNMSVDDVINMVKPK
ncbi:MAG: hypothetical protein N0E59_00785 [Candidatus Thiodiazotropha taylori]|nr:hypothetical protein [Candidatus Thiodiazotropha taylori]MCG8109277.1 hypothetical protein [Candidatus Thiodiazotropha taylori]MCW4281615.1 hypothetical protein [Candidatus Thiodiazotropha taylori]MCW4303592.1 hypothetical protein [Candidatus Thiodiazotropha taylori]